LPQVEAEYSKLDEAVEKAYQSLFVKTCAAADRRCFQPSDGRVLVEADYSHIELRVAAQIAEENRIACAVDQAETVSARLKQTMIDGD
jgi:DNA polymerase I-like protein with 3'-5' exonuclease and polymerase domains